LMAPARGSCCTALICGELGECNANAMPKAECAFNNS
jgi:hypothetical protein